MTCTHDNISLPTTSDPQTVCADCGAVIETMTELCDKCRQPLCPWEGERCEECLLTERNEREEGKDDRDEKANGQTKEARDGFDRVRGQAPACGRGVD
jgi:hypothetical protein